MKFLTIKMVVTLHDKAIARFGGNPGIRDWGLLDSAIAQPRLKLFGSYVHDDVFMMAAAYCFHIIKNHAFFDGNKRTGILSAIVFLEKNGITVHENFELLYAFAIKVAESHYSKEAIAQFFRKISDNSL